MIKLDHWMTKKENKNKYRICAFVNDNGLTITEKSEQKFFLISAIYLKLRPFS